MENSITGSAIWLMKLIYVTKMTLIMFVHACINVILKRIKTSFRKIKSWKNITHEKK